MRICAHCSLDLDDTMFDRTGKGGYLRKQCRPCLLQTARIKYAAKRDAIGLPRFVPEHSLDKKTCTVCKESKPRDEFHLIRRGLMARSSRCKACGKAQTYEWRAKNRATAAKIQRDYRNRHPERVKAAVDAWLAANPDYERERSSRRAKQNPEIHAARARAHRLKKTRCEVAAILNSPCAYCGGVATEIDHVVPLSRGGGNEMTNLAPACRRCNSSKGNRSLEEWNEFRRTRTRDAVPPGTAKEVDYGDTDS